MEPLILSAAAFAASLLLLYVGGKKTLQGAVCISDSLGINRILAGSTIVAMVTALPELMSSLVAALWGSSHLAFGNILGSNIYNVPLIIGLCGLIREFKLKNSLVEKECVLVIGLGAFLTLVLAITGNAASWLGPFLILVYPAFVYYSVRSCRMDSSDKKGSNRDHSLAKAAVYMVLGGIVLLGGTLLLVRSAFLIVSSTG